jgi:hypothetical protein
MFRAAPSNLIEQMLNAPEDGGDQLMKENITPDQNQKPTGPSKKKGIESMFSDEEEDGDNPFNSRCPPKNIFFTKNKAGGAAE